jgi:soluble lytic murein transglycosylase
MTEPVFSYVFVLLAAAPAAVQYLNALERLDAGDAVAAEAFARESSPGLGVLQPYGDLLLGRALAAQRKDEEALVALRVVAAVDPAGPLGRRAGTAMAVSLKALVREAEAVAALPAPRRDDWDARAIEVAVRGADASCSAAGFTLRECLLMDFPDRGPEEGEALRPAVRVARALALARRGMRVEAVAELAAAGEAAEAKSPRALLARGLAGDASSLLAASKTADRDVAPEAGVLWARALGREARYAEAVAALDEVAAKWPGHPQTFEAAYLAAGLLRDAGRRAEAVARWRKIAARPGPRADEARWFAGWSLFQDGDPTAAAQEWEALVRDPVTPLKAAALYWQGRILADERRLREAAAVEGAGLYSLWVEQRLGTRAEAAPPAFPPPALDGAAPPETPRTVRARALLDLAAACPPHQAAPCAAVRADAAAEAQADLDAARLLPSHAGAPPPWTDLLALVSAAGRPDRAMAAAVNVAGERVVPGPSLDGTLLRHVYPAAYAEPIARAAALTGVDPWLLTALARRESRFDEAAQSPAGARGLFQLLPVTAFRIASIAGARPPTRDELLRAEASAPYAAWYLSELLGRFRHPAIALAAYNAGPVAVEKWISTSPPVEMDRWIEEIPYRETRIYVKTTLSAWHAYHHLYGGEAPLLPLAHPGPPRDGARF